jgi:16S rRNA G966 N2-methylase RsmD
MEEEMRKVRTDITMDKELLDFIKEYAKSQKTSLSAIFNQFVLSIKRAKENDPTDIIIADPDFTEVLLSAIEKIKSGKMEWHKYDEVF